MRVVVNENETQVMPGCPDAWCPLDTFLGIVGGSVGCDWKEVCGVDERGCEVGKGGMVFQG